MSLNAQYFSVQCMCVCLVAYLLVGPKAKITIRVCYRCTQRNTRVVSGGADGQWAAQPMTTLS
jgi:hypothetical protein